MASDGHPSDTELSILNPHPTFLEGPSLLHHLIADEETDATALECHDSAGLVASFTYRKLHERTADLAKILSRHRKNTQTASITPLLIPQSAALYISQIAILKSGSAFCPLNLDVPEERLKFILNDVSATVVLTTPEFKSKFDCVPELSILILDHQGNIVESGINGSTKTSPTVFSSANGSTADLPPVSTTDPAYIMYTSGSTGTPKAVCLSHKAVTQSLLAHDRFIPQFSRFLQFANPTFDVSVFEIYFPLFRGRTIVSCDRTFLLSDLSNVITKLDVDGAELTPSVVASLVRSRKSVPKLRTLLTIGEMLNPQTVREFAGETDDDSLLWGMYGPTEAAIHCTLQPSFKQSDTVNTIGIPLDTVSCLVIKPTEDVSGPDDVQILPQGEVGELAVGGHQLADGYLNREEQTKAVFIRHPTYGPLYRTGDKAKLTTNGLLECLGRISKGQVKLRGQRIELGEIEHAASRLEGVHAASASVIDGQLVLFCVADSTKIKVSHVEASCRKWLPRFMVPNDIVIMKDFPYLPSGKTDSKKLDADYRARNSDTAEEHQPSLPDNRKLIELLRNTVNKAIKPASNLASAGLDSLKAIRLATELRKHGYPQLSAVDLLMCNHVSDLEVLISKYQSQVRDTMDVKTINFEALREELRSSLGGSPQMAGMGESIEDVFPCTPLQDAMLSETAKHAEAYCNSATFTLPSEVTFDALVNAIHAVSHHHPSLRSGFVECSHDTSAYMQVVWSKLDDRQFTERMEVDSVYSLSDPASLLRPLRFQFAEAQHILRMYLHHALYDQWSLDIFVDDLHRALHGNTIPDRPSFASVSHRSLEDRSSRTKQNALNAFWKSYMTNATITRLPNLSGKSANGRHLSTVQRTSSVKVTQLERLAKRYKVGTSVTFQAAYGYLLSLYAGNSDITYGTVFSGRIAAIEGVQDLFGPLLSTLPTRLSSAGVRRFKDLAKAVQLSNREIMANLDLPLVGIRKAADIDSTASLFDSIFVWQGSPREALNQTDVRLIGTTDYVEFNLTLDVEPVGDVLQVKATYREDILPPAQTQLFLAQLDLILSQLVEFPECRLDELFVDVRPHQCLSIHNPAPIQLDCTGGLCSLIDQSIKRNTNKPALCFAKDISQDGSQFETLSYGELSRRANQLSHFMLSEDLQPGGLVCIIMEKSVNLYISILAAIKAGCGYLPVVPSTPKHRIEKILEDAPIDLILCDRRTADETGLHRSNDAFIFEDIPISGNSSYRPRTMADPKHVAYAVYTSGTTGTPKGVLVTHENICSNIKVLAEIYPHSTDSRLLQACNQAFDVSVFEIFFTWAQGMCLCSASNDVLFRDLENSIRCLGITHLSLTPTVAALIRSDKVPNVECLITAGEPLTASIHGRWASRGLYQGYGPSETTNICSVNKAMSADDSINNIGVSFSNTSTFVLPTNGDFAPLPRGALGELCFGGQQVFMGYQNMPDLTASKIINHPRYGRIYRSGDLGRLNHDGTILIEGRTDTQRKIRGQRIELGEIERNLLQCDGVQDATALVAGGQGSETLVVFWIPTQSSKEKYSVLNVDRDILSNISGIKRHLENNLPSYMIPSFIIPVSAFPMTGQSKIDNACLLEDFADLADDYLEELADEDGSDDGEWSETDHSVRQILVDVLGAQENAIHRNTSLFGLGLDSITAIRLSSQLKSKFDVQMDVSAVLKHPRLALLSERLDSRSREQQHTDGHVSLLAIFLRDDQAKVIRDQCATKGLDVDRILPCTPLQEAMISASVAQGSGAYLNRTILKVTTSTDQLENSWSQVVQRHDIFRTLFVSTEHSQFPFVQVVLDQAPLHWESTSGTASPQELLHGFESVVPAVVDSFDAPYKLTLYNASEEVYLIVDIHHALYDANAMANLLEEVERSQRSEDLPSPISFDGFLEQMLHGDKAEADAFFEDMLLNFKPRPFPGVSTTDRIFAAHHHAVTLPSGQLQHFQKKHSVSLLSIIQASWSQTLSVMQNSGDLCFGNVVSGRTVPVEGIDRIVAPCFNTLPVRTKLKDHKDNLALVQHLHQLNIDALSYQLTPLRRIQQRLQAGSRLFDSLVLLQQPQQKLDPAIWSFAGEKGDMDFPCTLEVIPQGDDLSISLHYQQSLFSETTVVQAICHLFSDLLLYTLKNPLSDFAYDTTIDRRELDNILQSPTLPRKNSDISTTSSHDDESWTEIEKSIRDTLLSLSNVELKNVTKSTTIYRLGLDSISAIQAANRLKKNGFQLSAADILEHPTPAELARFIEAHNGVASSLGSTIDLSEFERKHRSSVGTQNVGVQSIRPCTAVQSGMLTASLRSKGRDYLNHFAYDASFAGTAEKLREALVLVVKATEILRTGFAEVEDSGSSFAMVTYEPGALLLPVDAIHDSSASFDSTAQIHQEEILASLDKPAWRCKIIDTNGKITLLLSMHHALYDAASLVQILDDTRVILASEEPSPGPSIDVALSHILANSRHSEDQQRFWVETLQAATPFRFPNLHPVIPESTGTLDISYACSKPRSELETLCSTQGVSLQAVFEAAWARLLAAYTGEDQVTFGIVHSGRVSQETQEVCFPTINTLPLTCDTTSDASSMLQSLMVYNAGLQKHCYTPLSSIHSWLGLQNEALFDTIFAFQKPLSSQNADRQWHLTYERAAVDYAVSIEVEHLPSDCLRLRTTFDSAILPEVQAKVMLEQLEALAFDFLGESTGVPRPTHMSVVQAKDPIIKTEFSLLHQMIDYAVAENSCRMALEFVHSIDDDKVVSQQWTYEDLDSKANQVAQLLHKRGIKPGQVVGLCFDKCPEASFAFLGIVKAGCCILAIDATAPFARKEFIISDSGAAAVLCSSTVADELYSVRVAQVLDLAADLTDSIPDRRLDITGKVTPESLSYILYTSGTTGTPKGCEITQDNLVQCFLAFQKLFAGRWDDNSVWLQFASYHFDVAILEHFWTWSMGMKLLCAPRDLILEDIASFIDRFQVTHLDLTPSLGRLLDPASVPSLHRGVFITGGEAVKPEMLRAWGDYGCLFNFYGPTECTIGVTTFPGVPTNGKAANIGWAFDNVGTCVLKPGTISPVPRGGVGELCIFGKLVGKGYLNRPDLNADRFPYIDELGERIYRTGDLVRLMHDDSFEFLGRADSQVKLRGQRLEIDEIIAVMLECESVKDAVCVVARQEDKQKDQLVAFVTPSSERMQGHPTLFEDAEITTMIAQAKAACEDKLPVYMVPTHFVPIHFIPLSVNNKQDDKLLKQFYQSLSTAQLQELSLPGSEQRALNDTELVIVEALAATLATELENIKPDANLFALGLSSISAVQLARRLKSAGHGKASIATVMQSATVAKLARALSDGSGTESNSDILAAKQVMMACQQRYIGAAAKALGITVKEIERVAPCTPLQQGILFKSQSSHAGLYFNRFLFKVNETDFEKLKKSLQSLIDKTDILRTAFVETEDGHIQVVRKWANLDWHYDSESFSDILDERHQDWIAANDRGLTTPFAATLAGDRLQICIHHALYDGNSWGLLMQRFQQIHAGADNATGASFFEVLPHGPLKFDQGAKGLWQQHLSGAVFEEMQQLVGVSAHRDSIVTRRLERPQKLDNTRKELQVTPQALVQAAWLSTLSEYHAGPIGLIVSGRSLDIDAESAIGPLFNTIPFAWTIGDKESWASFCKRCHDFNVATLPHQHTPLRDISKWLGKSSMEPLFETLFVFQQPQIDDGSLSKIMQSIEDDHYVADYPLSFEAEQRPNGDLFVTLGAQGHYCDDEILNTMIAEFEANLTALINDHESAVPVSDTYRAKIKSGPVQKDIPDANGYHGPFEWTDDAKSIRMEMASLASLEDNEIDEHTAIFAIGLDSIDAVKLSARLKKHGILVPVSGLMRSQTIPKILMNIKKTEAKNDRTNIHQERGKRLTSLKKAVNQSVRDNSRIERVLAATPMQEALVSEMIKSDYNAYFNHDILEVQPDVDLERLEKAWKDVINANPILRTAFVALEDTAVESTFAQVIMANSEFNFGKRTLQADEKVDVLLPDITASVRTNKQLDPPFRLTLVSQKPKTFLVLSIAHALYDGYSLSLLHSDVAAAYKNAAPERPNYDSIVDFALDATESPSTTFWESLLSNITSSRIPTTETMVNETHRAEVASSLSASEVISFAKAQNVTPQALIQTAWALYLSTLTQSLDVVYGLVLAGRDTPEAEEVLFPTMNTVASRHIIHGTAKQILQEVQEQLLQVREYQATPLRKITQIAKKDKPFEGGLFDALFTYQKAPSTTNQGKKLYESVLGASDVEYPVAVEAEIVGDELVWRNAVKSAVKEQAGVEEMLEDVDNVLGSLMERINEEVLKFEGGNVSVVGQEAFKISNEADQTPQTTADHKVETSWSEVESKIRDIVAKVAKLPVHEIGKTTRLENLGIDSISSIKLASLLKKQDINLAVSKIIKAGTVEAMASLACEKPKSSGDEPSRINHVAKLVAKHGVSPESIGFAQSEVEAILPVTAGQAFMLGTWEKSGGKLLYPTFTYKLEGIAGDASIQKAWQAVVNRHSVLRTRFATIGKPDLPFVQAILKSRKVKLGEDTTQQPFANLSVSRQQANVELKLSVHHALYDAISLQMLMSELEDNLNSKVTSGPSTTLSLLVPDTCSPAAKSQQQAFWTKYLDDPSLASLSDKAHTGGRTQVFTPSALPITSDVQTRLRSTGLSLQSLFFAAYAKIYAETNNRNDDLVIGIYLANRTEQTERLAVPTVNLLPVRVRSPKATNVSIVAKQIQNDVKKISEDGINQTSLWEIEQWTGVKVDVFLNFVKLPAEDERETKEAQIRIVNVDVDDEHEFKERAVVIPAEEQGWTLPKELAGSGVEGAYPPSIDIEATARNNKLAIGVFGFEGVIKLEEARQVLDGIKKEMKGFFT
ncbi:peptide synthetase [Elsinoe ampelina]|uniref:Peptide synthetase n=1 Tax=Elsinoe ampelina TaxID=302913 RepID=A0A6A6GKR0_9PEZI|nr:peptide synthetase [Elsinoe ampelina]